MQTPLPAKSVTRFLRYWLWEGQWDFSDPRWAKMAWWIALGAAIGVPVGLMTSLHLLDYLGPALGDDTGYQYIAMVISDLQAAGHTTTLIAFVVALCAFIVFRGVFIFLAFADYAKNNATYPNDLPDSKKRQADGSFKGFPVDTFFLFVFFNASMLLGITLLFVVFGVAAWCFGFGFEEGYGVAKAIVRYADSLAHRYVPTIVDLPPFMAVFLIYSLAGFFHYWLHRLSHEYRLLWLLLHRPHHMPSTLMEPLTTGVVVAFPFGFLVMFPYIVFFGACAKLFSSEPLFFEVLVFNIIVNIPNISAHSTSLYHIGFKHKLVGFLGHMFGSAQYHYLHHASHTVYAKQKTNLTNIGAGPWMLWDKLFGTYVEPPVSRPAIGLTGDPQLHRNPVRLLLSGLVQIIYELKHNPAWDVRMKIIFGKSGYVPPVSQDFVVLTPRVNQ